MSATLAPVPAIDTDLPNLVGNTPILRIGAPFAQPGHGFWAKLESHNPGGIKDRPALHMVARAHARGDLHPGDPLVESSSGTFALGLALAGAVYGHPVTVVSDPGLEPQMQRLLAAYGATIELVTHPHPTGGWQQARRDRVHAIFRNRPEAYYPNQYDNPDNAGAYATLAAELVTQLGHVDVLVCSVGTGGHSAGTFTALRRHCPQARLVGVDAVGSVLFGQPTRPRLMRGLGNSILPGNVHHHLYSEVHWVAPGEAVWACRQLATHYCVTGGWSVGAVTLVAGWLARTRPADTRIAAIFPDGPHRYIDTIFDDAYCRTHRLLGTPPPEHPDQIAHPREREVAKWTRCANLPGGTQ